MTPFLADLIGAAHRNPRSIRVTRSPHLSLLHVFRRRGVAAAQLHRLVPRASLLGSLDLLAGRFDGIQWRVTLDHYGRPLIYDSIHPCGCYHLFFAGDALQSKSQHLL